MDRQGDLTPGAVVHGLLPMGPVEVVRVQPLGEQLLIFYRDEFGATGSRLLTAAQVAALVVEPRDPVRLDADPEDFWLAAEAIRLRHAHLLNPLLALTSANVEPLPHQVQAVYDYLLRAHPQRFLLADDPGAGKTVMAGLYIKEAMARGWVRRCLVVVPGSLTEQWQDELLEKFGLRFEVFDPTVHPTQPGANPFADLPHVIVRIDQVARSQVLRQHLQGASYDLAVVDEAHKLTARYWGSKLVKSRRFELGEQLRDQCPNLLLMTATPHNGKESEFQLFLSLLDEQASQDRVVDVAGADLMRRLVKEQLVHADGRRLFPERHASTVTYRLSPLEQRLYEDVTEYVRYEMNKITGEESRRTVGFALLVLQRRLASSPEAILRSMARRRDRLIAEAERARNADENLEAALRASLPAPPPEPQDEWSPAQTEQWEEDAATVATTARTVEELELEIAILDRLIEEALAVRSADVDAKWEALAALLQSPQMYNDQGERRKIIIFTEHRDTLDYLEDRLIGLLGPAVGVEVIHGAVSRADRRLAQIRFTQERASSVLLATDAAGEGVNLQVAHLMVNYDIPWNPNRLEQRFGRIHRIGQLHECHLWNLVAVDTREGDVFATLLDKLEVQRAALGDRVFDVLGDVLAGVDLTQLLTAALTGASPPSLQAAADRLSAGLEEAVAERDRTVSSLTPEDLVALRAQMVRAAAHSLQPDVVRDFVVTSLSRLLGDIAPVGPYWCVRHVPARVRERGAGAVGARYEVLTFERLEFAPLQVVAPELVSPGHPLLAALIDVALEDCAAAARRGVVLVDDRTDTDYVLATLLVGDGDQQELVTVQIAGDDVRRADPAGFVDLPPAPGSASTNEVHMVRAVVAQLPELVVCHCDGCTLSLHEAELLAIALVRGTASPDDAECWRRTRLQARTNCSQRGTVRDAAPFEGWDFEVFAAGDLSFVRAVPDGLTVALRRHETQAMRNLGHRYEQVSQPDEPR